MCFWLFFYARTKTEEGGKIHVIILRNYTITTLFRLNDRIQQFCLVSQAINVWTKNGSNFTIDHFSLFCCCYFYFFDYYLWESKFSTLHFVQTLDHTRAKQLLLHTLNIKLKSKCSIFHTIGFALCKIRCFQEAIYCNESQKNTFKSVDDAFAFHESPLYIHDTNYCYKMSLNSVKVSCLQFCMHLHIWIILIHLLVVFSITLQNEMFWFQCFA